jgi:hypothetical protein
MENIMFNISDICLQGADKKSQVPLSGNPAVSVRPVAFRRRLAAGLALAEITSGELRRIVDANHRDVKKKNKKT